MEDFYIEGLKDTGKVCKACSSILSERLPTKTDRIFQIYKVGSSGSKKAALKVLISPGKLEALRYILEAILDKDEKIRCLAHEYLDQWYRYYGVRAWLLTSNEHTTYEEIGRLWEKAKPSLDASGGDLHPLSFRIWPLYNRPKGKLLGG